MRLGSGFVNELRKSKKKIIEPEQRNENQECSWG
jgi:hypothetical protein